MSGQVGWVPALIRHDIEINGVVLPAGRVAWLSQAMVYRLAADCLVSEYPQAIQEALQVNPDILKPFPEIA